MLDGSASFYQQKMGKAFKVKGSLRAGIDLKSDVIWKSRWDRENTVSRSGRTASYMLFPFADGCFVHRMLINEVREYGLPIGDSSNP